MIDKAIEFHYLLNLAGATIPAERRADLDDLIRRREHTLALELLIDNLCDFETPCTIEDAARLKALAISCRVGSERVALIDQLGRTPDTTCEGAPSAQQITFEALLNLPTAEEFARQAKLHAFNEVLIVRTLRGTFGLSFDEAVKLSR
jgi:hypothetical protein